MRTGDQIGELARGSHRHLRAGRVTVLDPPPERSFGMCGRLATYQATTPSHQATTSDAA
jgi:hypothetical protein